jgi:hypothetical protein
MSDVLPESPHWDDEALGDAAMDDLRRQMRAAQARMRDVREQIESTGRTAQNDNAGDTSL